MTISRTLTNSQLLRCSLLFVSFFIFAFNVNAQKNNYDLLWKISGKDLKQPSYLFGSMHVKSRKAFNFSDSVMRSIAKTSAFVLELHPDSMLQSLYRDADKQSLKAQLSDEQKEKLLRKYEEKYGKVADDESLYHPLMVRNMLKPDIVGDDDMHTFLDAYLYGIARTQGKKIFGLEKTEDQVATLNQEEDIDELFDTDEESSKESFNKLLEVYIKGNLNDINNYLNLFPMESLVERNKVMFNSISDLLKRETLFICVGAAHLPGEQGLIAMLKKEGYQVALENVSFTGVAQKYKIEPQKIKWYNYEADVFKASFPSMPVLAKETLDAKLLHYPDLMSGLVFSVATAYTPSKNRTIPLDSILQYMVDKSGVEIQKKQIINKNGVQILEVDLEKKGKRSIARIFFENDYFYTLGVEELKKDSDPLYVKKFFDSFITLKPKTKPSQWQTKNYDVAAFSVKVPVEVKEQVLDVADPNNKAVTKINMFVATDMNRHVNYIYRYNDFPDRYYLADKKTVLDGTINNLAAKATVVVPATTIYKHGLEGRAIEILLENTYTQVETFVRGNRQYLFLRQNLASSTEPAKDEFFDSFQLLPYQTAKGTLFSVKNVSTTWPDKPMAGPEDEVDHESFMINTLTYTHTNKNTGGLYNLEYAELSKYYRNPSIDSLLNIFVKSSSQNLSEVKETSFTLGGLNGKEVIGLDTVSGSMKKTRFWLQDNHMVIQQAIVNKEEMESASANAFFNDAKTNSKGFNFNLGASKANLIVQDLKSIDTNIHNASRGALAFYLFDKDEIPAIHQALQHSYADDTLLNGTRAELIKDLIRLEDKKSVSLLKTLYGNSKNPDELKGQLLTAIPAIDASQYDWYLNTLTKADFKLESYWEVLKPLRDSLTYTGNKLETIIPLVDKKVSRSATLSLLSQLMSLDTVPSYTPQVQKYAARITKHAMADLDEDIVRLNADGYPTTIYYYLDVLPKLDKKITDEFTKKVLNIDSIKYLKTSSVEARIKAGLPVDENLLAEQLDSLFSRFSIMHAYDQVGLLEKVPAKYRKPGEFGKLLVYELMSEDYELGEISALGEIEEDGHIYYVYSYEIAGDDEEKQTYLAVAGAFKKGSEKLDFKNHFADTDFEPLQEDWKAQAKAIVEKMKSYAKEAK